MTKPLEKIVCPRLPQEIPIHNGGSPYATIASEPLSEKPLSLQEIRFGNRLPLGPLYLDSIGATSCVYKVQTSEDRENNFSPDHFSEGRFWYDMRPYFGIPTHLRTAAHLERVQGVIYDSHRDYFYTPELGTSRWYLIGNFTNYLGFITSIGQFSDYLSDMWEKEPLALFETGLEIFRNKDEKQNLSYSKREATREIDRFLVWLEQFDAGLFSHTARRIRYSPEMKPADLLQNLFCRTAPQDAPYAFLDSEWGEIHFLPPVIRLLKKEEYEAVAEVLAHERSHHRVVSSGLVIPSHELLHRSVMVFFDREDHSDFWKAYVAPFLRDVFHTAIQCNYLFMTPEEEAQAHAQEILYAREKLSNVNTLTMKKEAFDVIDGLWKHSQEYFPASWMMLSAQYFAAAQDLQRPFMEDRKGSSEEVRLFKEDLAHRLACAFGEKEFCRTSSPAFQKLKKISGMNSPETIRP